METMETMDIMLIVFGIVVGITVVVAFTIAIINIVKDSKENLKEDMVGNAVKIEKKKLSEDNNITMVSFSCADDIRKYKKLLDDGIITEEEFETAKRELLNFK